MHPAVGDGVTDQGRSTGALLRMAASASGAGGSPSKPEKLDLKKLAGDNAKAPWHFKLLMVLLAVYLGWRLVQLIGLMF